jgi:hypothetical protein
MEPAEPVEPTPTDSVESVEPTTDTTEPAPEWQVQVIDHVNGLTLDEVTERIVSITLTISEHDRDKFRKQFMYEELVKKFNELGGKPEDLVMKMLENVQI